VSVVDQVLKKTREQSGENKKFACHKDTAIQTRCALSALRHLFALLQYSKKTITQNAKLGHCRV
jgi:hypothetical protein